MTVVDEGEYTYGILSLDTTEGRFTLELTHVISVKWICQGGMP